MKTTLARGLKVAALTTVALSLATFSAQAAPYLHKGGFIAGAKGDTQPLQVRHGRGADDGANHDVGDDKGGTRAGRGRGADDRPGKARGDDKGGRRGGKGRGRDDGPNHT